MLEIIWCNKNKAALILPTLEVPLVIVADYSFKEDIRNIGYHEFEATFAALPYKVDFYTLNPSSTLQSYSIFGSDNIIKNAIDSIKDFNLSTYLNDGIDYYSAFMAKYQYVSDIESAVQNLKNTAESLKYLTSGLLGDSNVISEITNSINNLLNSKAANIIAKDPAQMLSTVGKIFTNLALTTGNTTKNKDAYCKIINNTLKPITNQPYNAIKIINQNFIQHFVKSLAFVNYTTELLNSNFKLAGDIAEAHKEIENLFTTLNPTINTNILTTAKNNAVNYLNNHDANIINLVKAKINRMAFVDFLYQYMGRVDGNEALFIKQLNPYVDIFNWQGEIIVPQ